MCIPEDRFSFTQPALPQLNASLQRRNVRNFREAPIYSFINRKYSILSLSKTVPNDNMIFILLFDLCGLYRLLFGKKLSRTRGVLKVVLLIFGILCLMVLKWLQCTVYWDHPKRCQMLSNFISVPTVFRISSRLFCLLATNVPFHLASQIWRNRHSFAFANIQVIQYTVAKSFRTYLSWNFLP